jgi:hypothetical protein
MGVDALSGGPCAEGAGSGGGGGQRGTPIPLEGKIKNGKSGYFTTDYTDFDGFHGEDHCFLTNYPLTQRISDSIFITL